MWFITPHFLVGGPSMIQSLLRASQLLECFDDQHSELGIVQLGRMTGLNKSTVHHLVATLCAAGLLDKTSAHRYRLNLHILTLGSRVMARLEVGGVADPVLRQLQATLQETIHLAVSENLTAVYIIKFESPRSIAMISRVGRGVPLHCSGVGKILLAYNTRLLSDVLSHELISYTPSTITSEHELSDHLHTVRRQGYAIDDGEISDGLMCIAAPVYNYANKVVAAVSASGPRQRMRAYPLAAIIAEVKRAAQAVSSEMGYGLIKHL